MLLRALRLDAAVLLSGGGLPQDLRGTGGQAPAATVLWRCTRFAVKGLGLGVYHWWWVVTAWNLTTRPSYNIMNAQSMYSAALQMPRDCTQHDSGPMVQLMFIAPPAPV